MRSSITAITLLTAAVALFQGCLSPEAIRKIEGLPGQEGTGITMTRLPRVLSIIITYDATERQKEVAEERARQAVEILETKARPVDEKPEPTAKKPVDKPSVEQQTQSQVIPKADDVVTKSTEDVAIETKVDEAEAKVAEIATSKSESQDDNLPRYIAVDTEPDERLQGDKVIMLWDRKKHTLVGEKVYDVQRPPERGEIVLWDNKYRAQYVGSGT